MRTAADARIRMLSFGLIFGLYAAANSYGYGQTYPTVADRLSFAETFGVNKAIRLFYGTPYHLDTIGGYCAWRVGGFTALAAAFFGVLAVSRAFRGEEEAGRTELVAAGSITRGRAFTARLIAVFATLAGLWAALTAGLAVGGLPVAGSAYLGLCVVAAAAVYIGIGAVMCQLVGTAREVLEWCGAVLAVDFVVRVIADTTDVQALHWVSTLGWIEETRAFAGYRGYVLVLPALTTMLLLAVALYLERRRDIGASFIPPREIVERPRLMLLRSPTLLALRSQTMSFVLWSIAIGSFAMVLGTVSKSVAQANLPESIKEQLTKLGGVDFTTPAGYIGLVFLFFVLALALFGCSQLASIREDESEGRLETLFAQPQGRYRWLAGRLSLAATGAILLALVAGLGAAAGVGVVGAGVAFHRLVETGLNCLPASLLFLGLGALLVALAPRAGVGLAYAVVGAAFIWELVGALLGVPSWMLGISPFHQISLMPAQSFRAEPAAVMLAIGLATAAASLVVFRRRDLAGA